MTIGLQTMSSVSGCWRAHLALLGSQSHVDQPTPNPADAADQKRLAGPPRSEPKLLLTRLEAAKSLSMSLSSFERHVQPHIALIYGGRRPLVPVKQLEAWIARRTDV